MGQYQAYTDANGVRGTVSSSGKNLLATVLDDAQPRYIPDAEDQTAIIPSSDEAGAVEAERKAFTTLRERVDAYAEEHKANAGLTVSAHRDSSWIWIAALVLLVMSGRRR